MEVAASSDSASDEESKPARKALGNIKGFADQGLINLWRMRAKSLKDDEADDKQFYEDVTYGIIPKNFMREITEKENLKLKLAGNLRLFENEDLSSEISFKLKNSKKQKLKFLERLSSVGTSITT